MNIDPIDTAPLVAEVAKAGALEAFMLLVILALAAYVLYLTKESRAERKEMQPVLESINATLAGLKELVNVIVHKKD